MIQFISSPFPELLGANDAPIPIPGGFFRGQVFFPENGVLAKTVSLELERGNPQSRRRLETQVLHYDGETWRGYSYQWNDEQTDAELVSAAGVDRTFTVVDAQAPGGKRQQKWHFPARSECVTCHNPWANTTLAFTLPQLNREHDYGGVIDNQLRALRHAGLVALVHREGDGKDRPLVDLPTVHLTDPHDVQASLDERARSYLHANCAHCHRRGAGGTAEMELRYELSLEQTRALEVRPTQGTFEIAGAHILSPGDPYRSVLYYRMAKLGGGRMPHIGSDIVDERGLKLIHDWIRNLPIHRDERLLVQRLIELDEAALPARQKNDVARREQRATERTDLLRQLFSSTTSALVLVEAVAEGQLPEATRSQVLAEATASANVPVRDLFERFVPDEQRVKRLGSVIKPEQLLALKGDAERGRELFFKAGTLQCVNCHRVGSTGSTLGPELTQIAKKLTRTQLLESILEPSKTIDPPYVAYLVETVEGKVLTGLLVEKNDREVILKMAGDKEERIPAAKVATLAPQRNSLMPELLLRDLSAEQAVDLLEFLSSLK